MRLSNVAATILTVGTLGLLAETALVEPKAEAEQVVRWVEVQGTNRSAYFGDRVVGGKLAYNGWGGKIAKAKKRHGRWFVETQPVGLCRDKAMGREGIGILSQNAKKCIWSGAAWRGAGLHGSTSGFEVLMSHQRLIWVKHRPGKRIPRERILGPKQGNARYPLCLGLEFHEWWRPSTDAPRLRVESRTPGFLKGGKCWFPSSKKKYMTSSSEFWYLRRFDGSLKG